MLLHLFSKTPEYPVIERPLDDGVSLAVDPLTPGYVLIALCLSGIEVADTFGPRRYRCRDPQFPKEALH